MAERNRTLARHGYSELNPVRTGLGVGIYENTFARDGGVWKIDSLHFYPTAFTDYDKAGRSRRCR